MIYLLIVAAFIFCVIKATKLVSAIRRRHAKGYYPRTADYETVKRQAEAERANLRQNRIAADLRRKETESAKYSFKKHQAESDIEHWEEQIGNLYGMLDIAESERDAAQYGSKANTTAQRKIITLLNQIHAAESRLEKAKFDLLQAESKLSA